MSNWLIYALGFTAQLLFSGRMILQWLLSEKSKKIITPVIFWQLSLFASFLLFVYGYLRDDFAIMFGQALTYFIYIRNLQLQGEWIRFPGFLRVFLWIFPVLIVIYGFNNNEYNAARLFRNEDIPFWLILLGSVAQLIFNLRFVYQWVYSERRKISSLPMGFWLLSLLGSGLILIYAVFRRDPVLLAGHGFGMIMYIRNIYIHRNEIKG
ncbi:lipid-A-disaccharide synthase N-terminal domain-containing protein [Christiangramia crocea]|uniref:Lipid-A-disaccharide synthase N-terminal domain-containing protein n=1 Tax=Christiangramia crocea TaxID=2904124 RepID=A0A9X1UWK3_9FLAO|nr:lipid-A-disaccharide synthase N-terminal domain-containing protein [Gramella crocea]MCG9971690.1 lipid-A-disaccharide synthase N-terminal domain-containing protein [Gramella crocea]